LKIGPYMKLKEHKPHRPGSGFAWMGQESSVYLYIPIAIPVCIQFLIISQLHRKASSLLLLKYFENNARGTNKSRSTD